MTKSVLHACVAIFSLCIAPALAEAEILAMVNYETKSQDSLKSLETSIAQPARKEGLAIIDVDPASESFGKTVRDISLPADLVAHHIFYNHDASKAYITALGKPELRVIDMNDPDLPVKVVAVPDCQVGEDVVFSGDGKHWYLTCMGSSVVVVGDAIEDKPLRSIKASVPYPHGIAIHDGIDRLLITSTVRASDLGDAGESVTAIETSSGKVLGSYKVSSKSSPARAAPVEILFVPKSEPPIAYVTNMYEGTLWAAVWDATRKDFTVAQVFDFGSIGAGMPLEMYFNDAGDRFYVTTAKPGNLHIFDISQGPLQPRLLNTISTAEGAHHVAFTKDGQYAFVQNALLNLAGLSDGSITVIDLKTEQVVEKVNTLRNAGYNPNSIVLLPQWNHMGGH
jgi:DNA-binding beta-propeller fold protein YncE